MRTARSVCFLLLALMIAFPVSAQDNPAAAPAPAHEEAACVVDIPADASGREVKVKDVVMHTKGF